MFGGEICRVFGDCNSKFVTVTAQVYGMDRTKKETSPEYRNPEQHYKWSIFHDFQIENKKFFRDNQYKQFYSVAVNKLNWRRFKSVVFTHVGSAVQFDTCNSSKIRRKAFSTGIQQSDGRLLIHIGRVLQVPARYISLR